MAQMICLEDEFIADVKAYAVVAQRTVAQQIEYWVKIGKMAEDNPDLSFTFIQDLLLATEQVKAGQITCYEKNTNKT